MCARAPLPLLWALVQIVKIHRLIAICTSSYVDSPCFLKMCGAHARRARLPQNLLTNSKALRGALGCAAMRGEEGAGVQQRQGGYVQQERICSRQGLAVAKISLLGSHSLLWMPSLLVSAVTK